MSFASSSQPPVPESSISTEEIPIEDLRYRTFLVETMNAVDLESASFDELNETLSHLILDSDNLPKIEGDSVRNKTRLQYKTAIEKVRAIMRGKAPVELKYDVSDIDASKIEDAPHFDVLKELKEANERALQENPNHTANLDGVLLVWKLLPDDVKKIWNYKGFNPAFLVKPEDLEANAKIYSISIDNVPIPKSKVKINEPQSLKLLKLR